jgi:hypothetical protein
MMDDMACRDFVELVTAYLEDALTPELRDAFEAHVAVCTGCRLYLGQMRVVVHHLRRPPDALKAEARERAQSVFRQWQAERGV